MAKYAIGDLAQVGKISSTVGFSADSAGLKHKRVTTGSIAAGSTTSVTVSWTTAFADANYTPQAILVSSSNALFVLNIVSYTASQVVIAVQNSSGGALTGTLQVLGIHD
jgi:hypothetical protein